MSVMEFEELRGSKEKKAAPGQVVTKDEDDVAVSGFDDHLVSQEALLKRLDLEDIVYERGLTSAQVQERRARYGPNVLSPPRDSPWYFKLFREFFAGFAPILWIASILCWISWKPLGQPPALANEVLAIVLMGVVFLQAFFNFYQQFQSNRVLQSFVSMLPSQAVAIREGRRQFVRVSELTVGDLVLISAGVNAPADIRLIEVNNLKLDKSSLTGESDPVPCSLYVKEGASITMGGKDQKTLGVLEAANMAVLGTKVVEGEGKGIVVRVGDDCAMGDIMRLTDVVSESTTLSREITRFVWIITFLAILTGLVMFIAWAAWLYPTYGNAFLSLSVVITDCVSVIVAYIPEGLPLAVTMTLSLIAHRLCAVSKIIVTKLGTVETLGSVSLIASDKTGTITENNMKVRHIYCGRKSYDVSNGKDDQDMQRSPASKLLLRACTLCNAAEFAPDPVLTASASIYVPRQNPSLNAEVTPSSETNPFGKEASKKTSKEASKDEKSNSKKERKVVSGSPLDTALLQYCATKVNVKEMRSSHKRQAEVPFSSQTKVMISVVTPPTQGGDKDKPSHVVLIKGAPEYVINMCTSIMFDSDQVSDPMESEEVTKGDRDVKFCAEVKMDEVLKETLLNAAENFGHHGERTICVAQCVLPADKFPEDFEFHINPLNFPADSFCLLGLVSVLDPPRSEVAPAIEVCQTASIQVMMVTGDHASTAVAIARAVGIVRSPECYTIADAKARLLPAIPDTSTNVSVRALKLHRKNHRRHDAALVITGSEIDGLDENMWNWLLSFEQLVFARTTPPQKLKIVSEAQRVGHVVAVTGDGVNDAPALRKADVGVAMGSGSDVARSAADIILLNSSFSNLVDGIKQGRIVFDNLKKVIAYLLPAGSWSEMLPVVVNVFFGAPLALSPFLMIVICMLTDVCASLALVHEKAESDIMKRRPRNPAKDRLVDWKLLLYSYGFIGMLECSTAFLIFRWHMSRYGYSQSEWLLTFDSFPTDDYTTEVVLVGQSVFFIVLVICQIGNLFTTRTKRVPILPIPDCIRRCAQRPFWNFCDRTPKMCSKTKVDGNAHYNQLAPAPHATTTPQVDGQADAMTTEEDEHIQQHATCSTNESRNVYIFSACVAALMIAVFFTEVKSCQDLFQTRHVDVRYWMVAICCSILIFLLSEMRKWVLTLWPNGIIAKMAW